MEVADFGDGFQLQKMLSGRIGLSLYLEVAKPFEDPRQNFLGRSVAAVRHSFTKDTYTKKIELSRGSLKINLDNRINQTSG